MIIAQVVIITPLIASITHQAMRELWETSHGGDEGYDVEPPSTLPIWWGTWIIGNILGNISWRMTDLDSPTTSDSALILAALSSFFSIVAAYFLLQIINAVTHAQNTGLAPVEVFE